MKVQNLIISKNIKAASLVLVLLIAITGVVYLGADPVAADTDIVCQGLPDDLKAECQAGQAGVGDFITAVINVLLYIVGIAAVVMLIIAGLMYTVSGGDSDRIKTAKNMIIYSIVGIVVAFAGQAIIRFVLSNV
ncbi:MAG: hypothetical protein WD061_02995 [Candidatus Saccharimonadales bacterium]